MPGGICAKLVDTEFRAAARCSSVSTTFLGMRFRIPLGGFAEATFPDRSDAELRSLAPGDRFSVAWERAVFFGRHPFLGEVVARLEPGTSTAPPQSFVQGKSGLGAGSFFPALNRNYLRFTLQIPRFGLLLESRDPIINSAQITQVPPYGSTYKLERPVRYSPKGAGPLTGILSTTIETCDVKLVELANLKVTFQEVGRTSSEVKFEAKVTNETTEPNITISWMVWPDERGAEDIKGSLDLDRKPHAFKFRVPIAVLREQRWLALAIAEPFTTDAAQIERFQVEP
jgi:hypothetical protein